MIIEINTDLKLSFVEMLDEIGRTSWTDVRRGLISDLQSIQTLLVSDRERVTEVMASVTPSGFPLESIKHG